MTLLFESEGHLAWWAVELYFLLMHSGPYLASTMSRCRKPPRFKNRPAWALRKGTQNSLDTCQLTFNKSYWKISRIVPDQTAGYFRSRWISEKCLLDSFMLLVSKK